MSSMPDSAISSARMARTNFGRAILRDDGLQRNGALTAAGRRDDGFADPQTWITL
jgi:hypothetical protein